MSTSGRRKVTEESFSMGDPPIESGDKRPDSETKRKAKYYLHITYHIMGKLARVLIW